MARHHYVVTMGMVIVLILCSAHLLRATTKHLLTPEACTAMRYLSADELTDRSVLEFSPDGSQLAYLVQAPDLGANNNNEELYIVPVDGKANSPLSPILSNHVIAAVRWFPDGKSMAALVQRKGKIILARLNPATKAVDTIWEADGNISDYSMDAAGDTIAVAVIVPDSSKNRRSVQQDGESGYRIDLSSMAPSRFPMHRVYVLHRADGNKWKSDRTVTFTSPLTGTTVNAIMGNETNHINLSPNGRYLLLDSVENFSNVPESGIWGRSAIVNHLRKAGFPFAVVTYLYDVSTGEATIPLASPLVRYALWAPDSNSFVAVALAPAASSWEGADSTKEALSERITHMFAVNVKDNRIAEVLERAEKPPIAWADAAHIIVREGDGKLTLLQSDGDHWTRAKSYQLPLEGSSPYSPLTSDGHRIAVEYESTQTAPEILTIDLSTMEKKTVARLDPEMDDFILPESRVITWTTSAGYVAKGLLLLPPDYDPHRRYPIVIEDGSFLYHGEFVCDSGTDHVPSWPRGILADDGILYLTRFWPGINDWESNYYPKGLPGGVAEVAFNQDLIESAVTLLDKQQIIDPTRVGLAGFSRGGWYVEYILAHSQFPFRAATATDNFLGSIGEYWLRHEGDFRAREGLYDGPPYGDTLKNWLDYSISFNLDKIHTPLLTEVMGRGQEYNDPNSPPVNLATHEELLVGLSRLHKPVDFYYYPYEQHQPEHPQARIMSLHRNVDWFRFWLQGYEGPTLEEADQYKRWELMRSEASAHQITRGVRNK